jgi:hypothetical protein
MTLIEPVMLGGALIGSITGAVWGFMSGGWLWGAGGLFAGFFVGPLVLLPALLLLSFLITVVLLGPRKAWRRFRGQQDA